MSEGKNNGKILIVDDNVITINMLKHALESEGYQLFIATNGMKALQRAAQTLPDIILLDVLLPDIDGFETCRQLKNNEETKDIPVLFMTGLIDIENKVKGFKAGAVDYVTKPIELEEVLSRIQTQVTLRKIQLDLKNKNEILEKEIDIRQKAEDEVRNLNSDLELRVKTRTQELAKVNRTLKILSEANKALVHAVDENDLLQEICSIIIKHAGYNIAEFVFFPENNSGGCVTFDEENVSDDLKKLFSSCEDEKKKNLKSLMLELQSGENYFIKKLSDLCSDSNKEIAFSKGDMTAIILPLQMYEEDFGTLNIYSVKNDEFNHEEINLLIELLNEIVFGIKLIREEDERKRTKLEIEKMNEKLQELNNTKDKFFSIIAHDLKSPFQALIGLSEMLASSDSGLSYSEREEVTASIYSLVKNQYELLQNLLDWALIQQERMTCTPVKLNMYDAVYKTLSLLSVNYMKKNLSIENKIESKLDVFADENMLKSILQNFIMNSIKFTKKDGKIKITSSLKDKFAEITIEDNGTGISEEKLEQIFRLDLRSTTKGTEGEKGTGLGIILCKEMIERLGGNLSIKSQENMGTTIKFTVPLEGEN